MSRRPFRSGLLAKPLKGYLKYFITKVMTYKNIMALLIIESKLNLKITRNHYLFLLSNKDGM